MPPQDKPAEALRLRDVFTLWSTKSKKPSTKAIDTARRVVEAFEQVCGDPPLAQLTRKHGLMLRDHFLTQGMSARTTRDRIELGDHAAAL
ncbi:hypothetical protein [Pelomonas sp. Root1217]|uniref:hypothetical protein n=1 Tax=Pelomonas sp. Root1217 TaxID=1736430 RepID=UPI00138F5C86|nr:hypothetical protein [Pelomonas sp. Root1217]